MLDNDDEMVEDSYILLDLTGLLLYRKRQAVKQSPGKVIGDALEK